MEKKTYLIKSKIEDKLEVQIEKVGTGEKVDIFYRINSRQRQMDSKSR